MPQHEGTGCAGGYDVAVFPPQGADVGSSPVQRFAYLALTKLGHAAASLFGIVDNYAVSLEHGHSRPPNVGIDEIGGAA
jgi:hypothetical protein